MVITVGVVSSMQNSFELRLEKFRKSIDRLGIQAHANFIAYLLILLYFFVSVASTTHEDILKEAPKSIPLLSIQVPFLCFAVIGPWIILLVHLNQLLQYYYLSKNTFVLKKIISSLLQPAANDEVSSTSYFLVTNLILTDSNFLRATIKFFLWVFLVVGPVVICVLFLGFFLPYHSIWMTWNHRIVIVLDIAASFCFWPKILFGETGRLETVFFRNLVKKIGGCFVDCGVVTVLFLSAAFFSCGVLCIPGEFLDIFPAEVQSKSNLPNDGEFDLSDALVDNARFYSLDEGSKLAYSSLWSSGFKDIVAYVYSYSQHLFPRNLELANKFLIKAEPSYALLSQYSKDVSSYYPTMVGLVKEQGLGLDLRRRDLRYANFSGSYMPSCVFTQANLDYSNFSFGHLENATFGIPNSQDEIVFRSSKKTEERGPAYIRAKDVLFGQVLDPQCGDIFARKEIEDVFYPLWPKYAGDITSMSHVNFWSANLSGASFVNIKSAFSNFSLALLDGCCFRDSYFFGVNIIQANVKNSLFSSVSLVFPSINDSVFHQSCFINCNLVGALLKESEFSGVALLRTDFKASFLSLSCFSSSLFVGVKMYTTAFSEVAFSGTFFKGSAAENCIFKNFVVENTQEPENGAFVSFLSENDTYAGMYMNALIRKYKKCIQSQGDRLEKVYPIEVDAVDVTTEKNRDHLLESMQDFFSTQGKDLKKSYLLGPGPDKYFLRRAGIFSAYSEFYSEIVRDEFVKYQIPPMY